MIFPWVKKRRFARVPVWDEEEEDIEFPWRKKGRFVGVPIDLHPRLEPLQITPYLNPYKSPHFSPRESNVLFFFISN